LLILLDSTVLIDYLRGRPAVDRVRTLKSQGDLPATTAINVEEIVRGLCEAEVDAARRLFRGLAILPIDEAVAWQAGSWRRRFSELGVTVFQADCLIAAAVHRHRGVLCTGNPTDFPMSEVPVQHWPVGA
jgi:predicted nucleic acid-binding protein